MSHVEFIGRKFPFCDHKQPQRMTNVGDPKLSVGPSLHYVRGHIWWLGLKYVSSQMAFVVYMWFICGNFDDSPKEISMSRVTNFVVSMSISKWAHVACRF